MRKYYIDNLRWIVLLILIPYHTAQAWNVWGESNYIFFEANRLISSIIVFTSPFFMPLMFLLAGISTRYALRRRTVKEYLSERVKRLLPPLLFGIAVLVPVMAFLADKFHYSYNGGFFEHYLIFFTKFTDRTGYDGGFSFGQFWFVLYLLIISAVGVGIITLINKIKALSGKHVPLWAVLLFGLPLPLLNDLLSIAGYSFAEFTYLFVIGYYFFADDVIICKLEKSMLIFLSIGFAASVLYVYMFVWSGKDFGILNDISRFVSEWFSTLGLIGLSKKCLDFKGKIQDYMSKRSFLFYTWHFVWVVGFQYLLYSVFGNNTAILFFGTVVLSYIATFICCEICIRVPFLCYITGTKYVPKQKKS